MVYRYGWVAGIAAIGFGLWRLTNLLEPGSTGVPWQVVIVAAVVVGAVVTWAGVAYRLKTGWIALLNVVLFVVAAARYVAPDTGLWWILPNRDTASVVGAEISRAADIIRHGVEPVDPLAGLVLVIAALFWGLGALLVYGLLKERPFVALIPPLVVGLQLLTIERQPLSNLEIALFVLLVASAALAVGLDEHDRGAGRMTTQVQQPRRMRGPLSRSALVAIVITVVAAIGVSSALAGRIPTDGIMSWRAPGTLTSGAYGGISYNPYTQIYRGLVSQTGRSLFTAEFGGAAIDDETLKPSDIYYRLVTLDRYADGRWSVGQDGLSPAEEGFDEGREAYAGPNAPVTAAVTMLNLRQEWLPAPYSVREVAGEDAELFQIRDADASVYFRQRTYRGMEYQISADVPVTDSGAIARASDGSLHPAFQLANDAGRSIPVATTPTAHRELPDAGRYLALPDDFSPAIVAESERLTRGLSDFEKGLALEYWFREGGNFEYTLAVDTSRGHGPDALESWLLDDSDANRVFYRQGYCEQFATSMGVMARSIGIPSRVVLGFLPGEAMGTNQVLVTDLSGHSWVELWIPSQGWMRFDPTPRDDGANPNSAYANLGDDLGYDIAEYLEQVTELPAIEDGVPRGTELDPNLRLPEADILDDTAAGALPTSGFGAAVSAISRVVLVLLLLIAPLIGGIPALKWARRRLHMRRLESGDVSAAWDIIVAQLADLDRPVDAAATPLEVASEVGVSLEPLASVYTKSIYSQEQDPTDRDVYTAIRSMSVTKERLLIDLPPGERVRSTYRLGSLFGMGRLSRWLPWLRP